jgi:Ca-activated chloride channel family protein
MTRSTWLAVAVLPALAAAAPLAPGIDLPGPVPPPEKGLRAHGKGVSLDFGADRAVVKVKLPAPPRGGAAPFTFGDERDGWVAQIPDSLQLPAVAYGGGRVYVSGGFESFSFYALDAADGRMVWASQALEDNGPTAPIYDDDRIIFNTESCTLFVVDAKTGKKLWFKYLGDPTLAQPAAADGLVYASHPGDGGQALSAYRLRDGAEVWTHAIDGELLAAPVVAADAVYATTVTGRVYRFDKRRGRMAWSRALAATTAPWVSGDVLHLARRAGGAEAQVVVAAADGKIVREARRQAARYLGDVPHDLEDWKKVWAYEGSRPAVIGGVRYEAMGGTLVASDPTTGEALWTRRVAGKDDRRALGSVAVAGAQVIVATRDGDVYGVDIDTGYTTWAYGLGRRIVAQPIVARGWVYATTEGGQVVALHVGDASLDGWHMWGGSPGHNGPVP